MVSLNNSLSPSSLLWHNSQSKQWQLHRHASVPLKLNLLWVWWRLFFCTSSHPLPNFPMPPCLWRAHRSNRKTSENFRKLCLSRAFHRTFTVLRNTTALPDLELSFSSQPHVKMTEARAKEVAGDRRPPEGENGRGSATHVPNLQAINVGTVQLINNFQLTHCMFRKDMKCGCSHIRFSADFLLRRYFMCMLGRECITRHIMRLLSDK